jgi:thymidylate synthase
MRSAIEEIVSHGEQIRPGKGAASELSGVMLEINNPRARLSRTEARGRSFSCLGELCWYLAGSNELEFISYYIPRYRDYAEGGIIYGGYGPRLFDWKGVNQLANVTAILRERCDSRRAVIQLFDAIDVVEEHEDVPCTCALQFMLRDGKLHMIVSMRSNDAFLGLPHDVFCFTMLQEIMARTLSVELGVYKHAVGSLHLYDSDREAAQRFLDEGWQSTEMPMPEMPVGDPWPAIRALLVAESSLRLGGGIDISRLEGVDPYWGDIIRLLQVFRYKKDRAVEGIKDLAGRMSSPTYSLFIEHQLRQLS